MSMIIDTLITDRTAADVARVHELAVKGYAGMTAAELADFVVVTSDNPRTEDPEAILRSIEEGMKRTQGRYVVIENRREAIKHALKIAQPGDVVLLAGKGHETYQEIMGEKHPFDEKVVVQELLAELEM